MSRFLLDNSVKINVKNGFGLTLLSTAIQMNLPDVVKFLLSQGAILQLKDKEGLDSIYYANVY